MYIRRWNKSIANLIALLYITVHCCIRHCCIMLWVRCGMNTSHITTKKQHKAYQNQFTSNKYHYELNHCHVKCSIDVITWCSFSWDDARDCNNKKSKHFTCWPWYRYTPQSIIHTQQDYVIGVLRNCWIFFPL